MAESRFDKRAVNETTLTSPLILLKKKLIYEFIRKELYYKSLKINLLSLFCKKNFLSYQ